MNTTFTLQPTYLEQGIFNIPNQYGEYVGGHQDAISIFTGNATHSLSGTIYIQDTGQIRIGQGAGLRAYFQNYQIGQTLNVTIINPVTFWVHA